MKPKLIVDTMDNHTSLLAAPCSTLIAGMSNQYWQSDESHMIIRNMPSQAFISFNVPGKRAKTNRFCSAAWFCGKWQLFHNLSSAKQNLTSDTISHTVICKVSDSSRQGNGRNSGIMHYPQRTCKSSTNGHLKLINTSLWCEGSKLQE